MPKKVLPHSPSGPAVEPSIHHAKIAEPLRQIAPWHSNSMAIEHRLNQQSIAPSPTAYRTLPPWQNPFDPLPLIVP